MPQPELSPDQGIASAELLEREAVFEDAVRVAKAIDPGAVPADLVADVLAQFEALRSQLATATADQREAIEERAMALERLWAYVMPPAAVVAEARMIYRELRDLSPLGQVLGDIKAKVDELEKTKDDAAKFNRAVFEDLLDDGQYWNKYIDWYVDWRRQITIVLAVITVVAFLGSGALLWLEQIVLGFVVAGIAGTGVSILGRLPQLTVYGEVALLGSRVLARYVAGLVGTVVVYGFLVSGILTISAGQITTRLEGTSGGGDWPSLAVIMAIGILSGFSERSLTSFEEMLFAQHGESLRPTS